MRASPSARRSMRPPSRPVGELDRCGNVRFPIGRDNGEVPFFVLHGRRHAEVRAEPKIAADAAIGQRSAERNKLLADRKSTRLNSSHPSISYAVFCLKKKN